MNVEREGLRSVLADVSAAIDILNKEFGRLRALVDRSADSAETEHRSPDLGNASTAEVGRSALQNYGERKFLEIPMRRFHAASAADAFVQALQEFGLDRVSRLNERLCGRPLVSRERPSGYPRFREVDGWYVLTHSNTRTKLTLLRRIAKRLEGPAPVTVSQVRAECRSAITSPEHVPSIWSLLTLQDEMSHGPEHDSIIDPSRRGR
jgi:hypothetical protein